MQVQQSDKKELLLFLLFSFALTFLLYGGVLDNFFTSDDFLLLKMAKDFSFGTALEPIPGNFFRPVIKPVFAVLFDFFALNPMPYHFFVLVLHAINTMLVFLLAKLFFSDKKKAFFAAIAFCAFFLNAEVLFEIATINELLLALFSLLCFLFFVFSVKKKNNLFFVGSVIFFSLALLSKESAIFFLPLLVVFDLLFFFNRKAGLMQTVFRQSFFALVFFVYLLFALVVPRGLVFNSPFVFLSNFFQATMILFFPLSQLAVFFARPLPQGIVALPIFLASFFALLALVFFALKRKQNVLLFSLFWFFVFVFPSLSLGAIQSRYFYLPFVGGSIFFASIVSILLERFSFLFRKRFAVEKIFFGLLVFFVLFSAIYIWVHEGKHDLAGNLVENFISDAKSFSERFSGKELFFLNRIDRIDTVLDFDAPLVLRNGLKEAFFLFGLPAGLFREVSVSEAESLLEQNDKKVLLFSREKKHLSLVKKISFSQNLLDDENWLVESNSFLGTNIYSKPAFLHVTSNNVFFELSSGVSTDTVPVFAFVFTCKKPPLQQKCVGAKGDDWGSFDAGVFSLGKQNDLLLFFEVPEQYNFFFLRFVLHSKGKAVFSNTQLRQVFFEIE